MLYAQFSELKRVVQMPRSVQSQAAVWRMQFKTSLKSFS